MQPRGDGKGMEEGGRIEEETKRGGIFSKGSGTSPEEQSRMLVEVKRKRKKKRRRRKKKKKKKRKRKRKDGRGGSEARETRAR